MMSNVRRTSALRRATHPRGIPLWVACRDPPVESSSPQADIEPLIDPSRPVLHDGSLRPRGRPTLPSLRPIGLRRVDSKAPCGACSQSCRGRSRSHDRIVMPFHECATSHPGLPISSVSGMAAPGVAGAEAGQRYWIRQL